MIILDEVSVIDKKGNYLKDLNIKFLRGKINIVFGMSNSGKSLLLKTLVGLQKFNSGVITIGDNELTKSEIACNFAFVGSKSSLYPKLNVINNLKYFSKLSRKPVSRLEIQHILEKLDLINASQKKIDKLTLFEKRRLMLAIALSKKSSYLVLDDIIRELDLIEVQKMIKYLYKLKEEGLTIIMATKDLNILSNADYIAVLNKYELINAQTKDKLIEETNSTTIQKAVMNMIQQNLKNQEYLTIQEELEIEFVEESDSVGDINA